MKALIVSALAAISTMASLASASSTNSIYDKLDDAPAPYVIDCDITYVGPKTNVPGRTPVLDAAIGGKWKTVPESMITTEGKLLLIKNYVGYEITVQPFEGVTDPMKVTITDKVKKTSTEIWAAFYQEAAGATKMTDLRFGRMLRGGATETVQLVCWRK